MITLFSRVFILCFLLAGGSLHAQSYDWSKLGGGLNEKVYAMTVYNGILIVAGGFRQANGISANFIAQWNGTTWLPLGTGMNDTVYALCVFDQNLYAAGRFTTAGGVPANHIARWDGITGTWYPVGTGIDGEVRALTFLGNNYLYAGGKFSSAGGVTARNMANWDRVRWDSCGSGVNDTVFALTLYNNDVIAGGKFDTAGGLRSNYVAGWTGSNWFRIGSSPNYGTNGTVFALTLHNSELVAGGRFTQAGGIAASYIASWNGSTWSEVGGGVDNWVYALASYNTELIAGGIFKFTNSGVYGDRIAKWNGSVWSRMVAGMNNKVSALLAYNGNLYAGGEFTTAGGRYANRIARWWNQPTFSVAGQVRFADNNQLVLSGRVRVLRLDVNTREVIVLDTAQITTGTGNYFIDRVVQDSTYIMTFPDDEDFVPTYYPSDTSWMTAVKVYTGSNLTNINIAVRRMTAQAGTYSISGHVYLNYNPPFNPPPIYPYKGDAVVYARQGNVFRKYAVTNTSDAYTMNSLIAGTYELFATRLGYTLRSRTETITGSNLDSVDFYLDTTSVIGIEIINTSVPDGFALKQNYPNPFNPVTRIKFDIPSAGAVHESPVQLLVFDILGREAATLVDQPLKAGSYEVSWDAANYPSGVYFYTLRGEGFSQTKKMILLK